MPQAIAVAVIEDDAPLRSALVELIGRTPGLRCTGDWGTAEAAWSALRRRASADLPDVLVLDLMLPGMEGIPFLREAKRLWPGVGVLTYSQRADDELVVAAIQAGAEGYALKRNGFSQLELGIQAVHRGEEFYPPSIARKLARFVRRSPPPPHEATDFDLTPREIQLLDMARHGLDAKEMADGLGCTYATVRSHFDHIRRKLGAHTRAEAVARFYRL
jgi:DNA-binding NarL/FixJ family response regulator